jgi:eukaryotic-like serine/threonine-protein kinase
VLVMAALLPALGFWTYSAVEGSLREIRAATMRSLLDSEVNALRVWIREEIADAERLARDPRVREAVTELARTAARSASRDEVCAGPARAKLEEVLRPLLRDVGDATFNLTDRTGRLLATRYPDYCGLSVTRERFLPLLEPVFAGASRFLRPVRDAERVGAAPKLRPGPPYAWIAAPVRDDSGNVIAALGIAQPADGAFASILQGNRSGTTGEAFAFDAQGAILTPERFGERAPLHAHVQIAVGRGEVLEPYLNHRGAEVVGAWRWLDDLGVGVAIEIAKDEAYAPLRFLQLAFGAVFGALVIAVIAALGAALSVIRLRRQMGEGRRLGPYVLEEQIGEGGMANVYRARHNWLKRPCALKLLKPARATDEMIARFEREVQLASQLSHPNTVEIFDYGHASGLFYYAMEFLDGINAGELVAHQGALPVPRALHLLRQVCAGLAEAHARGIVHRDIKPENIMVCRYGGEYDFAKILDFGLVKSIADPHSRDLTRTLRILGTPLYMAPERLRNPADVDARADIYAVGAVAFFLLAGRKMFEASDDLALTSKVLNEEPPRVSTAASQPIPLELDLLVQACVEKKRENRPQRVTDLLEALDELLQTHPWTQEQARLCWARMAPATRAASGPQRVSAS